jgi:hypothetical protein
MAVEIDIAHRRRQLAQVPIGLLDMAQSRARQLALPIARARGN